MGGKWEEVKEKGQVIAIENKSVGPACNKGLKTDKQGASLPAYLCQGLSASWHHQGSHAPLGSYSVVSIDILTLNI